MSIPDIIIASEKGDLPRVKSLLRDHPELISAKSRIGNTAIHAAALQNQVEVVKFLLKQGADIDTRGDRGMTPLHFAVDGAAIDVGRVLLKAGANPDVSDDLGRTPIQLAAKCVSSSVPQTKQMLELLKGSGSQYDLATAVNANDSSQVRKILQADPAAVSRYSGDAGLIYWAVLNEADPGLIKLLLEHGADPNAPRNRGYRDYPITKVADPVVAELLLANGAKVDVRNLDGMTALQRARKYKLTELEKVLRQHGAKVTKKTARKTPATRVTKSSSDKGKGRAKK